MEDLKPCGFCGMDRVFIDDTALFIVDAVQVRCIVCEMRGPAVASELNKKQAREEAARLWNMVCEWLEGVKLGSGTEGEFRIRSPLFYELLSLLRRVIDNSYPNKITNDAERMLAELQAGGKGAE